MSRIFSEALFDIKKMGKLSVILLLQISLLLFALNFFSSFNRNEIKEANKEVEISQEMKCYNLVDNLVGDYETEFLRNDDALIRLKSFYSKLKSKKEYGYVEAHQNAMLIFSDKLPETTLLRYESGEPEKSIGTVDGQVACDVNSIVVSAEFMVQNEVKNEKGNVIQISTFDNSRPIVVLGYEYSQIFDVGDEVRIITPLRKEQNYIVAEILEEGANVFLHGKYLNLDRYAVTVFPPTKSIPDDYDEYKSQVTQFLMLTNGQFNTTANPNEIQDFVNEACNECGIYPSSQVTGATNAQLAITGTSIEALIDVFKKLLVLVAGFSIVSSVIFISIKVSRNKKYCAVLIMNGYSKKEIFSIIVLSFALILVGANIVGLIGMKIFASLMHARTINPLITILANVIVLLVATASSFLLIKETEVEKL